MAAEAAGAATADREAELGVAAVRVRASTTRSAAGAIRNPVKIARPATAKAKVGTPA